MSRAIPGPRLLQYSLVQLAHGVHTKRIRATMTSETSAIAVDTASAKHLTTKLLGATWFCHGVNGTARGSALHQFLTAIISTINASLTID